MRRALAVGFGFAVASAAVMFACGGDDSNTGGAGTANTGTAGSGTGTAGSANGAGGSLSGAGGAIDFDAAFDLDALFGNYTCADLAGCCAKVPAMLTADCNTLVTGANDAACSIALTGFKAAQYCN